MVFYKLVHRLLNQGSMEQNMMLSLSAPDTRAEPDINEFSTLLCDPMTFQQLQHLLFAGVYSTGLLDYLSRIPKWLTLITALPYQQYQFGTVLEQWLIAYQRYPLALDYRLAQTCTAPREHLYPEVNGLLGIFLIELRQLLLSPSHKNRLWRNDHESNANYQSYCAYVNDLFECYSRLVVLRLDLSYQQTHVSPVTFEQTKADVQQLFKNTRHNHLFNGLEGYIGKIEYGLEKQMHIHSVWFFNAHQRRGNSHVYLAQCIGEYWCNTITHGAGTYWNCNDNRGDYRHNGIGLIEARDADKRHNLLSYVVKYLCKKDSQEIKPRNQPQAKTLFRGDLRNRNPNLGRPRNNS